MTVHDVSLDGLRSLSGVLDRLPQGQQARKLAEQLGLWSSQAHNAANARTKIFGTNFSRLSEAQLSDENAYWLSEVFRATELVGLLEGQKVLLTLSAKSVRASSRAALRRKYRAESARLEAAGEKAPKDPSATQLADEVEENADVQEADAALGMLAVVAESAKAYKEACLVAAQGLSREISFRQAQMGARIRGT
jgi:hypothetical protein